MNNVALCPLNLISLCSGVGMLDEGLRAGLEFIGIESRIVLHVEREIAAVAQLATLMEAGCLDAAPIWDDLTTLDCRPWRGLVAGVVAGFPCQPHSVAGRQKGIHDDRWIWPDINRIIRETESSFAFLENVPGLFHGAGIEYVMADLTALGFDAEWCHLPASAIGASHKRERVFILAYRPGYGWGQGRTESDGQQGRSDAAELCGTLGNTGLQHGELQQRGVRSEPATANLIMDDACGERRQIARSAHGNEAADEGRSTPYCYQSQCTNKTVEYTQSQHGGQRIGFGIGEASTAGRELRLEGSSEALAIADGSRLQGGGEA